MGQNFIHFNPESIINLVTLFHSLFVFLFPAVMLNIFYYTSSCFLYILLALFERLKSSFIGICLMVNPIFLPVSCYKLPSLSKKGVLFESINLQCIYWLQNTFQ